MDAFNSKTEVAEGSAPCSLQGPRPEPVARESDQTATHAVLSTPELLCNIISQLPLPDIVATTGVCHFWRNAIAADPQVQKALFLSAEEVHTAVISKPDDSETQELLSRHEPGTPLPSQMCCVLGDFHPFLRRICGVSTMTRFTSEHWYTTWYKCRVPKFEFPHGKWRRMFISQPPCKSFFVGVNSFEGTCDITYDDTDGIRLGGLYDKMVSTLSNDDNFGSTIPPGTGSQQSDDTVFYITTMIENYCERGVGTTTDVMEVPVQGGFARWSKDPVWIPRVEERSNGARNRVSKETSEFAE